MNQLRGLRPQDALVSSNGDAELADGPAVKSVRASGISVPARRSPPDSTEVVDSYRAHPLLPLSVYRNKS
jgi:hypothetical protein